MARPSLPVASVLDVVGGIEQKAERRFKPGGDFGRVGIDRQVGRDNRQHGGDVVTATGLVAIGLAHDRHVAFVDAELLPRLAQRGFARGFAGVELAAGERGLSRVRAHVRRAVDQQHAGAIGMIAPVGDRDQHCGFAQHARWREIAITAQHRPRVGVAMREQLRKAVFER